MTDQLKGKITIDDEDKIAFDGIWQCFENRIEFDAEEGFGKVSSEYILNCFIEYLSKKYNFNPNSFSIYDKEGRLVHSRVLRNQESVN